MFHDGLEPLDASRLAQGEKGRCATPAFHNQGYTLLDLGETNMGMTMDSVASPQPAVRFFDVLSWR